jgi:hypothetical protein
MSPTELKMQPTIHLERKLDMNAVYIQLYLTNVLWVAFSIPLGSLLLHLVAKESGTALSFLVGTVRSGASQPGHQPPIFVF